MDASPVLVSLFKYKAWANDQILAAMKDFDAKVHGTERHNAIRILNHTYVVDRIFAANLQRLSHEYTATNTTGTPCGQFQ